MELSCRNPRQWICSSRSRRRRRTRRRRRRRCWWLRTSSLLLLWCLLIDHMMMMMMMMMMVLKIGLYFDSMTPYESNVNSLFTSLVDSSSIYNFNKFQISPPGYSQNDVVYGLFQCRGDLNSSNCKECVTNSVSQLKTNCPVSTSGGIQLDGCFVKYDNSSFFGAEDKMEVLKRCGPSVGYNSDVLNRVDAALANLIAGNGQYFRSCDYGSIQGVAQCVQDLSVSDCLDCLSQACGRLRSECETSTWGDMYLGKCYIRYFDQGSDSHAHDQGTSSSNKSSSGGSGSDIKEWIAIILSAMTATGTVAYAVTNSNNNINVNNNTVKNLERGLKSVKEKAEDADKKAEQVKKSAEKEAADKKKEEERALYPAYGRPPYPMYGMPPCPFPNPNTGLSPYPMYGMPPCPMPNSNPDPTCTIL